MKHLAVVFIVSVLSISSSQAGIFKPKPKPVPEPTPIPAPVPAPPAMPVFQLEGGVFHDMADMSKQDSCSNQVRVLNKVGTVFLTDVTNFTSGYACASNGQSTRFDFVFNKETQRWQCLNANGDELSEVSSTEFIVTYRNGTSSIFQWVANEVQAPIFFKGVVDYGWSTSSGNCKLDNGTSVSCSSITIDMIIKDGTCDYATKSATQTALFDCKAAGNMNCQIIESTVLPHLNYIETELRTSKAIGCYARTLVKAF